MSASWMVPANYGSAQPTGDLFALATDLAKAGAAASADVLRRQGIDPDKAAKDALDAAGVKWRLTDQPWFWPAAIGGGVLLAVLLWPRTRSNRAKTSTPKAEAKPAPARPASRFTA